VCELKDKLNTKWLVKFIPFVLHSKKEKQILVLRKLRRNVPGWAGRVSGIHTGLKEFVWKDNSKKICFANFRR
jgi:hypothetical protein